MIIEKSNYISILVGISAILLLGCGRGETWMRTDMSNVREELKEYIVDSEISVDKVVTKSYGLRELRGFFEKDEDAPYSSGILEHSLETINSKFPIECMRVKKTNGKLKYYILYDVKEGGYYYVFADELGEVIGYDKKVWHWNLHWGTGIYIPELKEISDFSKLRTGTSSFEEVQKIDVSAELNGLRSCGVFSYSRLKNGNYLEISYCNVGTGEEERVNQMRLISEDEAFTHLRDIWEQDLPK